MTCLEIVSQLYANSVLNKETTVVFRDSNDTTLITFNNIADFFKNSTFIQYSNTTYLAFHYIKSSNQIRVTIETT